MGHGQQKKYDIDPGHLIRALDHLRSGFALYTVEDRLIYANPAARELWPKLYEALETGCTRLEAIRKQVEALAPDADPEKINAMTDYAFSAQSTKDGCEIWGAGCRTVLAHHEPIGDYGFLGFSVDITELKIKEKELKKKERESNAARQAADAANEAKSVFLANMSHEVRTPLNAVLGMAQVLREKMTDPELLNHVDTILDSGETLLSVVNDVLDISKIEAGKMDIAPTPGHLSESLGRLKALWSPTADDKNLDLHLRVDAGVPRSLNFDQVRVRQCVSNLVSNALKFTEHGSVTILVDGEAETEDLWRIRVRVVDTGIGVSEEAQQRLFGQFEQADAGAARRYGGTGLGLSITRDLARLMGGDVTIDSALGEGSTFTFTFKAEAIAATDDASVPPGALDASSLAQLSDARVLLVDDNPVNRLVVRTFLNEHVGAIIEASNGHEALEHLAQRERVDLVLLDKHMPTLDGPATLRRIRSAPEPWSAVPVVALTAEAMSGERERLLAMGMDGYVTKPIDRDKLLVEMLRVMADADCTPKRVNARTTS